MNDDWSIFEPPDKEQLARHADDLIHRANLVRRHGWDDYRHRWSCGEVLGAALVLGDDDELERCGETTISALERWAFDLWESPAVSSTSTPDCSARAPGSTRSV
jgi:hypothetical protein